MLDQRISAGTQSLRRPHGPDCWTPFPAPRCCRSMLESKALNRRRGNTSRSRNFGVRDSTTTSWLRSRWEGCRMTSVGARRRTPQRRDCTRSSTEGRCLSAKLDARWVYRQTVCAMRHRRIRFCFAGIQRVSRLSGPHRRPISIRKRHASATFTFSVLRLRHRSPVGPG